MTRATRAWRTLAPEQRLAAVAAAALWLTLLLPWYHKDVTVSSRGGLQAVGHNVTGFGAFSFVEAAVLLVSLGVLAILFARGEGRDFHLPGNDGLVVMVAGAWTALLVFYRMLDTPSLTQRHASVVTDVGVQWGIFIALLAAGALAYAGWRMRASATPEPPLLRRRPRPSATAVDQDLTAVVPPQPRPERAAPVAARPVPKRPRYPPAPSEQLSFEDTEQDAR
jgi:hypothetical protein